MSNLTTLPVILVDVDGGFFNLEVRNEKYKELFRKYAAKKNGGKYVNLSAEWDAYAKDCMIDPINQHVLTLLTAYKAAIPNLEVWFMCDRQPEYIDYTVNVLQTRGFLSTECKGIITSRSSEMKYWRDCKIKEYYLYSCFLDKGKIPMLALDDRDETLDMYRGHRIPCMKVFGEYPEESSSVLTEPKYLTPAERSS